MSKPNRYLLDTNTCSYIAKARKNGHEQNHVVQRHFLLHAERCYISVVTRQEMITWINLPNKPEWQQKNAQKLLRKLKSRTVDFTDEESNLAGVISADLRRMGKPLETPDIQIAATALHGNFTLVTHDKHFDRITGLSLVDWYEMPLSQLEFLRKMRNIVLYATLFGAVLLVLMTLFITPLQDSSMLKDIVHAPNILLGLAGLIFVFGITGAIAIQGKLRRTTKLAAQA